MKISLLIKIIPFIIVLIVMIFHSIIGYINGTKKTIYYIIVDITLTIVILIALSFVTIQKLYTMENLLSLLERIFVVPEAIKKYFETPELNQFIYILTDIIVRILLFFGIITITKWVFKFGVFKPIFPKIVNKTKKTKKDRIKGAIIGSFKGLVLGLVFIIPILFMENPREIDSIISFDPVIVENYHVHNYNKMI